MSKEKGYKLTVTGCGDCPLSEYIGGPTRCAVTKLRTNDGNQGWASCPLKKKDVIISLSSSRTDD